MNFEMLFDITINLHLPQEVCAVSCGKRAFLMIVVFDHVCSCTSHVYTCPV